jgi:FtsZ-binding cell division protein ZapB
MRLTSALRSVAVASLLFAVPVLAQTQAPAQDAPQQGECDKGKRKGFKWKMGERKVARMEAKLDRAVSEGRLSQVQADQLKAEGRQLRDEVKAQRETAGGQLSEEQRSAMGERLRAFRAKVKAAVKSKDGAVQQPAQRQ